ncbi:MULTISPECIES: SdrD B-like domain-containing protein [unclassified Microcoleus]|uniref:SdrD B-like domain-containing protein n=1 Tax=unclassified Microcoleus TaxID=2642155 RepID=UPI002FD38F0D
MADNSNNSNEERIAQQLQPVVVGNAGPAILGIKFFDQNRDGIRQPTEIGLRDVPILLEPATSSNGVFNAGTGELSTTTDANGAFSFINLVPGNYVLTETAIPPGLTPTTPNPLAVTVGNRNVNVLFGNGPVDQGSRIVGCKYLDIDADGFRDGNEPGIKNVRIYIDANGNGQRDAGEPSTLTDKNGAWSFNVAPGTYKIREERIIRQISSVTGLEVNATNAEPLETQDFPQSTPPGNVPVLDVTVAAGQTFACAQVGDTPLYQIEVNKFRDIDRNGLRNVVSGVLEPPIARVPFILDVNGNGRWDGAGSEPIAITDANGVVTFKDLRAGNYRVLEIFPSVLPAEVGGGVPGNLNAPVSTTANPALVSAPGPQARFQGTISREQPLLVADSTYTLKPNDPKFVDSNRDGVQQPGERSIATTGERPIFAAPVTTLPAPNPSPSLTFSPVGATQGIGSNAGVGNTLPIINVFKYNDLNANGRYEPNQGEAPISGVSVFLDTNNNGTPDTGEQQLRTNDQGRAAFTNLSPGNYIVREVVPPNFSPSTADRVDVTLNLQDANVTFANTPSSNITGCKFEDFNLNGYRDGNEPAIPGVSIFIDTNGDGQLQANEPTTTTNQFGTFAFNNLRPGTYKIREVTPPGYFQTTQPVDVVLGANQTFTCALVGNSRRYDLLVPKFRDDNRNGIKDGNEPPLADVPFTLDLNGNGRYDAATEPLVRTDAAGIARFNNLSPASYSVLEVFDTPGVPNNFPIRTGPNPVSFDVPGPNTVPTTPERVIQSVDPVTGDTGVVTASSIPDALLDGGISPDATVNASSADSLLAPQSAGFSPFVNGDDLQREASSLVLQFLENNGLNDKDSKWILGASSTQNAQPSFS